MPPPILRIRAAFWLSGPALAKRRSVTPAAAAIPGVRMAKVFGSAAYAMLNRLTYSYQHNLRN
eukprot:2149820-Pleurochrysis_carterae.AAC.3